LPGTDWIGRVSTAASIASFISFIVSGGHPFVVREPKDATPMNERLLCAAAFLSKPRALQNHK
jgi:hypothetical protein